jgi:hypothetical protein
MNASRIRRAARLIGTGLPSRVAAPCLFRTKVCSAVPWTRLPWMERRSRDGGQIQFKGVDADLAGEIITGTCAAPKRWQHRRDRGAGRDAPEFDCGGRQRGDRPDHGRMPQQGPDERWACDTCRPKPARRPDLGWCGGKSPVRDEPARRFVPGTIVRPPRMPGAAGHSGTRRHHVCACQRRRVNPSQLGGESASNRARARR